MLNKSIIKIRVALQNAGLKQSGQNKFAGFNYFELGDFLPTLNQLMLKEEINDIFTIEDGNAILILIKGEEKQEYKIPFTIFPTPVNKSGQPSMQDIQYLGALNTYYKRYLYMNAFGITDGEIIDNMNNEELMAKEKPNKNKLVTERQLGLLQRIYKGENLKKVLDKYELKDLNEMPFEIGKDLIARIMEKKEKNNE